MIAGYCWPQSVLAGETVGIFCHADAERYRVEIVRQGADDRKVFESPALTGVAQPLREDLSVKGCGWQASLELKVDSDWPSGFYLVRMTDSDGVSAEAFFVVRSAEPADAMLVLATSTWSAYNDWGGPSFYTGSHTVSTQRPLLKGSLAKEDPARFRIALFEDLSSAELRQHFVTEGHSEWSMAAGWANWESLFVRWAEKQGLTLGYAISQDLDRDPDLLTGYPAYISVGHDEYWSSGMRDTVEGYVDSGGHAAFFSGNTSFWQARFTNDYTQVVCYKNAIGEDPAYRPDYAPALSTMWCDPLLARPENQLTGVSFSRGGYAHMPNSPQGTGGYTVWRPAHWAFEGLELRAGDQLGCDGIAVGYECDGCELELRDGLPVATGRDGTPEGFEVLATAPAHLWETHEALPGLHESYIGELNWVAERLGGGDTAENRERFGLGRAVMGSFKQGRGEVFTSGCTDWAYALGEPAVATVTRNVLDRFTATKG